MYYDDICIAYKLCIYDGYIFTHGVNVNYICVRHA